MYLAEEDGHASRDSFGMQLFWNLCVPRDVDLSSSLPSLAALQFRMLLKSGRELEQRLKYCVLEIVKSKPIHTER